MAAIPTVISPQMAPMTIWMIPRARMTPRRSGRLPDAAGASVAWPPTLYARSTSVSGRSPVIALPDLPPPLAVLSALAFAGGLGQRRVLRRARGRHRLFAARQTIDHVRHELLAAGEARVEERGALLLREARERRLARQRDETVGSVAEARDLVDPRARRKERHVRTGRRFPADEGGVGAGGPRRFAVG